MDCLLLVAPQESSEIYLASPSMGSVDGGYEVVLVGKRFKAGFKVRIFTEEPDGRLFHRYSFLCCFYFGHLSLPCLALHVAWGNAEGRGGVAVAETWPKCMLRCHVDLSGHEKGTQTLRDRK